MAVEKLCLFGASLLFCFSILEATSTETVSKLGITYIQPVEPDQRQYLVVKPKYEEANINDTTVDHTKDTEDVQNVSAIENRFLAPQITTPNRDISDGTTPGSEKISSVVPTLQIEDTSEVTNILNPSVHVKRMNTANSIENEVKTASLDDTLFESVEDEKIFNDQYANDENSEVNGQDSGQNKSDSLLGMSIPDEQSVYKVVQTKQLDSNQDYTIVNSDLYSSGFVPNDRVIYTDTENNIEYPDTIKLQMYDPDKETTCVCFNNKLKYLNEIINSVIQKTATVNYETIEIANGNTDYENLNEYKNIRRIVPEYYTDFQPANNIAPVNTETYNYPDDKRYFINLNNDSAYNTQNFENNDIVMKYIVYSNQYYRHENFKNHYTVLYKIINEENVENILENDVQVQNIILNQKINVDSVFNYVLKRYLLHTFINYFQQILHFRGVTDVEHVSKVFNNFIKYIVRLQLVGYTEPKIQQILTYLKLYLKNLIEKQHQRETQQVNNIDYIENYDFDDNKNNNPVIIFSNDDTKSRFIKFISSSSEFSNKNVDYSNLDKYYTAIEDIINNRSTEYDLMIKNLMKNLNIDTDAIYKSVLEQFNRNKLIIYCQKMLYNEGITDTTYVWKVHNNFVNYVVYLYLTGFAEPEIRDVITYIKLYLMNFIETPDKNKFEDNTPLTYKDEIFKIKEHEAEDISVPNDDVKEKIIQYILSNNKFVDENYAYEQLNNHYTIIEEIINNKNIENEILIIKQRRIDVNLLYKYLNEQYKLSAFKDYFEKLLSKRGVITDERYITNIHKNFVKYISQLHLEGYTESQIRNVIMYTKLYLVISIENQTQHQDKFDIRRLLSYIYEILYKKFPWLFGYNENHQQAIQDIILKHVLLIKHNKFINVYEINTEKRPNYIANIEKEILNYVIFNNLENYEEIEDVGENNVYYMQSSENKMTQDNVKEISIKYILSDDRIRNEKFGYDHLNDVYTEIENIINNKGMEHDLPIKTLTENGKTDLHSIDKSLLDQYNLSEYKYYFQKLLSNNGITDVGMILRVYDNFVTYILKLQFEGYTQSEIRQIILYIKLYLINLIRAQNNPYEDKQVYETVSETSDDDNHYNTNEVIYVANESEKDKLIQHILSLDKIPGENIGYNELKKHYIVLEDIINNNEGVQNDLQIENLIENREIDVESSYKYISNLYDLNELKKYFQTFLFERAITDTNYVTKVYDNFIKYILKLHLFGYTESHIRRVVTYVELYLQTFITADDSNQIDDNAVSVDNNGYVDTNLNYETKDYNINGYTTGNLKDKIAQYILSNKEVNGENVEYNDLYKYYTIVEDIINDNNVLETDLETVNYLFNNRDIDYNIIGSVFQTIYEQYKLGEFKHYFRVLLKSRGVTDELYLSKVHDNFVKYIFKLHLAGYNELQIHRAITYMKFYIVILLRRPVVNQSTQSYFVRPHCSSCRT